MSVTRPAKRECLIFSDFQISNPPRGRARPRAATPRRSPTGPSCTAQPGRTCTARCGRAGRWHLHHLHRHHKVFSVSLSRNSSLSRSLDTWLFSVQYVPQRFSLTVAIYLALSTLQYVQYVHLRLLGGQQANDAACDATAGVADRLKIRAFIRQLELHSLPGVKLVTWTMMTILPV